MFYKEDTLLIYILFIMRESVTGFWFFTFYIILNVTLCVCSLFHRKLQLNLHQCATMMMVALCCLTYFSTITIIISCWTKTVPKISTSAIGKNERYGVVESKR